MKGIVLAGGTGSRLWPLTLAVSKQLLPVYDKPMIFYPLATLTSAGIRDILIITRPEEQPLFERLLGDGSHLGFSISYRQQPDPDGIASALLLARGWLHEGESVALILGDNLFHGAVVSESIIVPEDFNGARIFAYEVADPRSYGVVEFTRDGRAISLEEKPQNPRSRFAVPGLYVYDGRAVALTEGLKPSARGELEITDLNRRYLDMGELEVVPLPRGVAWLDTGTFNDLHDASGYIRTIEARQGVRVASLEEISWRQGWLSDEQVLDRANFYGPTPYGDFLRQLARSD